MIAKEYFSKINIVNSFVLHDTTIAGIDILFIVGFNILLNHIEFVMLTLHI